MKCKHFLIQQLVPPTTFEALGESAWALLSDDLLTTLDQLYEAFGPMTVNNWHSGGRFRESGLRDPNTATGAPRSQHKVGRAADIKPLKLTVREMYDAILADPSKFPLLTTLENIEFTEPGKWIHVDVRPRLPNQTGIRIVNP